MSELASKIRDEINKKITIDTMIKHLTFIFSSYRLVGQSQELSKNWQFRHQKN